jgi:hypothetical protein
MGGLSFLAGQIILGWVAADFASGVFHWIQDRILPERTPFLGEYLAAPARLHHDTPLAFVEGSFIYRNGATYALAAVTAIASLLAFGPSAFLAAFVIGIALTTQVHLWAHCPKDAPGVVRVLHETGLIQSPKQHSRHHTPPQNRHYCVLTDLLNPVLERIGFWTKLERAVKPRNTWRTN